MPASPDDGARLAARIARFINALQTALLELLARRLKAGIDSPGWVEAKLAETELLRQQLTRAVASAQPGIEAEVRAVIRDAHATGRDLALADTRAVDVPDPQLDALERHTARIVADAARSTTDMLTAIYRQTIHDATSELIAGNLTRVQATQRALDELASRGITGFRDKAGRNWALDTYVEMAVRTAAGQAAVDGHVATLRAAGVDLVIISDAPRECPVCRIWERQVLSISGRVGAVIEPSGKTGNPVPVRVKASLDEARLAGLFHPNCRHFLSAFTPGVTVIGTAKHEPERYEAGQRQREIERRIREWKRRQAVALSDEAARQARRRVRQWQAELRRHIAQYDLPRRPDREQVRLPK